MVVYRAACVMWSRNCLLPFGYDESERSMCSNARYKRPGKGLACSGATSKHGALYEAQCYPTGAYTVEKCIKPQNTTFFQSFFRKKLYCAWTVVSHTRNMNAPAKSHRTHILVYIWKPQNYCYNTHSGRHSWQGQANICSRRHSVDINSDTRRFLFESHISCYA